MSELKARKANSFSNNWIGEYYEKSEADNVIEELKDHNFKMEKLFDARNSRCIELQKQIRHHKYKRCLAMARWCEAENYTACWYHENSERCEWTEKWRKRWQELAEKFKHNNSTAQ